MAFKSNIMEITQREQKRNDTYLVIMTATNKWKKKIVKFSFLLIDDGKFCLLLCFLIGIIIANNKTFYAKPTVK